MTKEKGKLFRIYFSGVWRERGSENRCTQEPWSIAWCLLL